MSDPPSELHLLYETSRRISTAMTIDEVVTAYLDQVAAGGGYACSVALYDLDSDGSRTSIVVHGRWTPGQGLVRVNERHPYARDNLDPPLDAGQTITIPNVAADPRVPPALRAIQRDADRPALAMIPLIVRSQRIGLVLLSSPREHHWEAAELHPYQVTAAQLAAAIDSRRQNQLLHERSRALALLEERQRLARDLHDSVTQLLFSLSLIAQSVAPAWQRHPAEGQARIARLLELSQAAHRELRLLLTQLSPFTEHSDAAGPMEPRALERVLQQGLPGALRSHIAEVSDAGIRFSLRTNGYRRQASDMEEALYRVGQEAINNAVKHAGARNVGVAIRATHRGVSLSVRDDGCGFDLAVAGKKMHEGHFGLPIMRQRITALGGTLEIVTEPGKGTRLGARLPTRIGQT